MRRLFRRPSLVLPLLLAAAGRRLSFEEDERGLTVGRTQARRPRLYYRRELEARPLVVARVGN